MVAGKVVTALAGKLGKVLPHLGKKGLMKDLVPSSLMSGGPVSYTHLTLPTIVDV